MNLHKQNQRIDEFLIDGYYLDCKII